MYLTIYNRTTFLIHLHFGTRYHSFREMLKVTSYDKKTLVKITWLENLVLLGVMSSCLFWYCWLVLLGRPSCKPFMSFVDVFTSIRVLFWSFWFSVVSKTLCLFSNNFLCLCPLKSRAFPWSWWWSARGLVGIFTQKSIAGFLAWS